MRELIKITDDLFGISDRLKQIDSGYEIYYNFSTGKFEVHNSSRSSLSPEFVVPFEELDARTVDYALYTRVENAEKLLAEMEKHNALLEQQQAKEQAERTICALEKKL